MWYDLCMDEGGLTGGTRGEVRACTDANAHYIYIL